MKKKLLLWMLTLGLFCIKSIAQTKLFQSEEDGFEWYIVCNGDKYGAKDKNGKTLIPTEYDKVEYDIYDTSRDMVYYGPGFKAKKGKYYSYYLRDGQCVIPLIRKYVNIEKFTSVDSFYKDHENTIYSLYESKHKFDHKYGTYYVCRAENRRCAICNAAGKEIFSMNNCIFLYPGDCDGRYYFTFQTGKGDGEGLADANGNIIFQPDGDGKSIKYDGDGVNGVKIVSNNNVVGRLSSINTTSNLLANNPKEKYPIMPKPSSSSSSSNTSSSSSSSSSNNNSGNSTTTVVVEHHRDPVPVQEWHACWACGGMGTMGCDNCGGSGTKYIGDRLHRCSRCNGGGIIPCNICHGNKGQYTTVYR